MQHLVLGGARSGKSRYAESLAAQAETKGKTVFYLATAQTHYQDASGQTHADAEMLNRIEHHQSQRPSHWQTIETPIHLAQTLAELNHPNHCVLVDCLTLWTLNLLQAELLTEEKQALLALLPQFQGELILVSNEVGMSVVPLGNLSRQFVDELGWLHQALAEQIPNVTFLVAGLATKLK